MSLVDILWHVLDGNHHTSVFSTSEGAEVSLAYRKTWFIKWMIYCGSNYESEEKHFTLVCSFKFLLLCRNSWITNKQGGLNAVSLPQCNRNTMKHQITQTYTNRKIVFIYKIGCSRTTFWICAFWDACTSKSSTLMPSTAMHVLSKIIHMCSLHSENQIKQSVEQNSGQKCLDAFLIPIGICHTPIPPVALPWIGVSQSPGSITVSLKIATISLCGTKSSKRLTWLVWLRERVENSFWTSWWKKYNHLKW